MNFEAFRQRWTGQRVDFDGVYGFQCVDLIIQYLHEGWGENSAYGNAIDFWTRPSEAVTRHFDRVEGSDARAGDIVIFKTRGHTDYLGNGHIGIATGALNAATVEVLEQNGMGNGTGLDGDAIRTRWIDRGRVAGMYRPKPVEPPAPPAPEPVVEVPVVKQWPAAPASAPDTTQYEVVKLLDGWETSNRAINHIDMPKQPVGAGWYYVFNRRFADADPTKLLAVNVTNVLGQAGAWIATADNVPDPIPEPTPPPVPTPTPPPDWPVGSAPREAPPALPPPLPTPTPEPEPVVNPNAWKDSYNSFRDEFGEVKPRKYVAYADYEVTDLGTQGGPKLLKNNDFIYIGGTFIGPDGKLYGRPQDAIVDHRTGIPRYMWYGVPLDPSIIRPYAETYNTDTTPLERRALRTAKPIDYISITLKETEGFIGKFWDIITGAAKIKTNIKK